MLKQNKSLACIDVFYSFFPPLQFIRLTVELWRPAPGQTIKTYSPTQDDTQDKAPLLGSPTMPLLYCPNLTTTIDEWKNDVEPTRHGAVVAGKFAPNSNTTLPAHNPSQKSRHDACSFLFSFPLAPARDCDPAFGLSCRPLAGRNGGLGLKFNKLYLTQH